MVRELFPHVFRKYANYDYIGFQKEEGDHTIYHIYFKRGNVEICCIEHVFNNSK